jgi:hypothetical protein
MRAQVAVPACPQDPRETVRDGDRAVGVMVLMEIAHVWWSSEEFHYEF